MIQIMRTLISNKVINKLNRKEASSNMDISSQKEQIIITFKIGLNTSQSSSKSVNLKLAHKIFTRMSTLTIVESSNRFSTTIMTRKKKLVIKLEPR